MTVIIPHPTEELKLIQLQKELISGLNNSHRTFYANPCLWIELSDIHADSKAALKNIANQIKKLQVEELVWDEKEVFLNVEIVFNEDVVKSKLHLLTLYSGDAITEQDFSSIKSPITSLKIFRIASSADYSEKVKSIEESVWVKLKV